MKARTLPESVQAFADAWNRLERPDTTSALQPGNVGNAYATSGSIALQVTECRDRRQVSLELSDGIVRIAWQMSLDWTDAADALEWVLDVIRHYRMFDRVARRRVGGAA